MWWYFIFGLLVGWLLEWIIDWVFWRRGGPDSGAAPAGYAQTMAAPAAGSVAAMAAARAEDDLSAIEGIGPKISQLLRENGIRSFHDLADAPISRLVEILDLAGPSFRLANPQTWPEQAALAARGDWVAFNKLKDELLGGLRVSGS